MNKPRSAAGNRIVQNKSKCDLVSILVVVGDVCLLDRIRVVGAANITVPEGGGHNGQRSKKYTNNQHLGPGGWPKEDPLHSPPIQIESFM